MLVIISYISNEKPNDASIVSYYVFSNFSAKPRVRASRDSLYQTPNFKTKNLVYINQDNIAIAN